MSLQDLRFALRQLIRNPTLTVIAILVLGVGIGATTALFSVVDAVVLEPLPFPEPEELVRLQELTPDGDSMSVSAANFLDFKAQSRSFEDLAAVDLPSASTLTQGDEPERFVTQAVTPSFFRILDAEPVLGRNFLHDETIPGEPPRAVILTHGLWQRRFGGDPDLVGQALELDGASLEVVGVLPEGFSFLQNPELFLPLAPDPDHPRDDHRLEAFGRLADGVSVETARSELGTLAARLAETYPDSNEGYGVLLTPFRETHIGEDVIRASWILFAAVGLLLLLACANVSNLLLARATTRRAEMALRTALGAGREQLIRQLLTESIVLAVLGAGVGVLVAFWSVSAIASLDVLPALVTVDVDREVLIFALGAALVTGLVFGLAPALQASHGDIKTILNAGGRNAPPRERRLRDALAVGELALATILLVAAGLLGQTFLRLLESHPGFTTDGVVAVELSLPAERYPEFEPPTANYYREIVERLEALPGVEAAGAIMVRPWSGLRPRNQVVPERGPRADGDPLPIQWRAVTPGSFDALEIPLLSGRLFGPEDRVDRDVQEIEEGEEGKEGESPALAAVVSRSLAERLWPVGEAVGERLRWGDAEGSAIVVVGVVGDVQDVEYGAPPPPMLFVPHESVPWSDMTIVARTAGDTATGDAAVLAAAVQREIRAVDPVIAVPVPEPLAASRRHAMATPRFHLLLMTVFAAVALLLAATGVYGVLSFAVAERSREIGIRLALGARPADMMSLVLRVGLRLIVLGLGLGVLGAVAASQLLESLLYETPAVHPATYAAVAVLLASVAFFASYLPGRRATRVDPREAILNE